MLISRVGGCGGSAIGARTCNLPREARPKQVNGAVGIANHHGNGNREHHHHQNVF